MKQKCYPYPVLGNGDDISGEFTSQMKYSIYQENTIITCIFKTTNEYIADLIKKETATYCVEIQCSNTFFRFLQKTCSESIEITIPSDLLKEKVDVSFYICAVSKINDYRPRGTHADFDGETFNINCADILAIGGYASFVADKKFDPLNAPISSIIQIAKSKKIKDGEIQVNYDEDEKIIIELPEKDFEFYLSIKNNSSEMLHSAIVLPVLVDAIYEANGKGSGNYQDSGWSNRLKQISISQNISMDVPFLAAQKILENPINRTLNWLNKFEDLSNE